jgi:hypothetical protein
MYIRNVKKDTHYIISEEGRQKLKLALAQRRHWIAYNSNTRVLRPGNIEVFSSKAQAIRYAALCNDRSVAFHVLYAPSFAGACHTITTAERLTPDLSPQKIIIMDEKTMQFNENQLKRSGFAEAFTGELIEKMKEGVPLIEQPFSKIYDSDRVDAVLHLKKSTTSDHYFLGKFDLKLIKGDDATQVSQTFYITVKKTAEVGEENSERRRQENRYTLKEAYNLLDGRPVFKRLFNREGEDYTAWVKLNFANRLENGNFEIKQFTQNYGFNLENTLAKYPIKELENERFKNSLLDSLHRGNLQKATFLKKDGGSEELYVSPNISFGSLNIYSLDKERLSIDKLSEKQFIAPAFASELKERVAQFQKQMADKKQGQQENLSGELQSQKQDVKPTQQSGDHEPSQNGEQKKTTTQGTSGEEKKQRKEKIR